MYKYESVHTIEEFPTRTKYHGKSTYRIELLIPEPSGRPSYKPEKHMLLELVKSHFSDIEMFVHVA